VRSGLTDDALAAMLVGDLEPFRVELVDYDPRWPEYAQQWIERLRPVLPEGTVLEHVGSTSVPGMKAKAVIDLLALVDDPEDTSLEESLATCGLYPRVHLPGRRTLRTADHDVQLHVFAADNDQARDVLRLRDVLRQDAGAREIYEQRKVELARRPWRDMHYYSEAKSGVISQILGST
jgi:GrpB-like predicted nucleotidyltransferase (UPF0157 family)